MRVPSSALTRRLAGAGAASGLALAGLVLAAAPASAAACSGTSGVTVVVDTGGSVSTRCASGDPSSAMQALGAAGFSVTYPQQYPGSVVCRIDGYPASDPCVRMPPADAYWAFFHARRGGSWAYSSTGAGSYDPAPGTVVGFRFGSGQQPRVAPPAPTAPPATSKPGPTTAKPTATSTPGKTAAAPKPTAGATSTTPPANSPSRTPTPAATPSASGRATPSSTASVSPTASGSASPTTPGEPTSVTTAPASKPVDGSAPGTLLAGGALVALVAAGAGVAAWKRRG